MKQALANILSLCNMVEGHCVTFDSEVDNAFFVHTPTKQARFGADEQGIYIMDLSDPIWNSKFIAVAQRKWTLGQSRDQERMLARYAVLPGGTTSWRV